MKNYFLMCCMIAALGINGFAQISSNLFFFSGKGELFYVFLNGIQQNHAPSNNVRITNVPGNNSSLILLITSPDFKIVNHSLSFTPGLETKIGLRQTHYGQYYAAREWEMPVVMQPPVPHVFESPYKNNLTAVAEAIPENVEYGNTGSVGTVENSNNNQININIQVHDHNVNSMNEIIEEETPEPYLGNCPAPVADGTFYNMLNSVQSATFEKSKLTVAQQITKSNCLTSAQIRKMTDEFSFEGTKLEYAKFAFDFVYDTENYFVVNNAFDFDSSINNLNNYISGR